MEVNETYNIVSSGELVDGFYLTDVQVAFAELFKCSEDKAKAVVGKKVTLKKQVDERTAKAYKSKLESIGLAVDLHANKPPLGLSLSLQPIEGDQTKQDSAMPVDNSVTGRTDTMVCPKCNLEQPKTEQCTECGVYIHKVLKTENPQPTNVEASTKSQNTSGNSEIGDVVITDAFNFKAVIAAGLVAVFGALVWKYIAMEFDRELGLIAWAIGGAVGFTSALMGSRGQNAGIICGVFTVIAILGGKYLFYSDMQGQIQAAFQEVGQEEFMRVAYENFSYEADQYALVTDDQSIKTFMVDFGYTDNTQVEAISNRELSEFKADVAPELVEMHENKPNYEEWVEFNLTPAFTSDGALSAVVESLDWLDLLFLLFGVATAFRLGSRQTQ